MLKLTQPPWGRPKINNMAIPVCEDADIHDTPEIQELIANRLRADAETQAAILQCRTLADLQAIQVRFFETAFRQYMDGITSLMGLGAGVMTQGIPSTIRPG